MKKRKKDLDIIFFSVLLIIIAIMAVLTPVIPAGQCKVDDASAIIAGSYEICKESTSGIQDVMANQCHSSKHLVQRLAANGGFLGVVGNRVLMYEDCFYRSVIQRPPKNVDFDLDAIVAREW